MKSTARPPLTGSEPTSADDAFSGEWFARYLLDAAFLVVLMLTVTGIALYLDAGEYLRDWGKDLGPGFLVCLLLCPMLGVITLALAIYAGVRLFLRPRTLGHAFVRLALLAAHVSVFCVCVNTILSTTTALLRPSSAAIDPSEVWRTINGRDFSPSQEDAREGAPDAAPYPPPRPLGIPGLPTPGGGMGSR